MVSNFWLILTFSLSQMGARQGLPQPFSIRVCQCCTSKLDPLRPPPTGRLTAATRKTIRVFWAEISRCPDQGAEQPQ